MIGAIHHRLTISARAYQMMFMTAEDKSTGQEDRGVIWEAMPAILIAVPFAIILILALLGYIQ